MKIEEKDYSHTHMCQPAMGKEKEKEISRPNPCYGCGDLHFKK